MNQIKALTKPEICELQKAIKRYGKCQELISKSSVTIGRKIGDALDMEIKNIEDFDFIFKASNGEVPCNKETYDKKFRATRKFGIPVNRIKKGNKNVYKISENEEELYDYMEYHVKKMLNKIADAAVAFILNPKTLKDYVEKKKIEFEKTN